MMYHVCPYCGVHLETCGCKKKEPAPTIESKASAQTQKVL